MSDSFLLKASFTPLSKEVSLFLKSFANALYDEDMEAVKNLMQSMNVHENDNFHESRIANAFCPNSEYRHFENNACEKLLHTLQDSMPITLNVSGKDRLTIKLEGNDVGTTDLCVFFLLMLNALSNDELTASAKSLNWMAKWISKDKALYIKDFSPLEAGQKNDSKADEKQRKRNLAESKKFLKEPYGFIADEIEKNCEGSLSKFLPTITSTSILGHKYTDLTSMLRKLESYGSYFGSSFDIVYSTSGSQEVRVSIFWKNCDISADKIYNFFEKAKIPYINTPIDCQDSDKEHFFKFGDYEWGIKDIAICAKINDASFEIKITQSRWISKMHLNERLSIFVQGPVLEAIYWRDLYFQLEDDAKIGNQKSIEQLNWLREHPRPGCPNYADHARRLHEWSVSE